jgi:hypothetical protein
VGNGRARAADPLAAPDSQGGGCTRTPGYKQHAVLWPDLLTLGKGAQAWT